MGAALRAGGLSRARRVWLLVLAGWVLSVLAVIIALVSGGAVAVPMLLALAGSAGGLVGWQQAKHATGDVEHGGVRRAPLVGIAALVLGVLTLIGSGLGVLGTTGASSPSRATTPSPASPQGPVRLGKLRLQLTRTGAPSVIHGADGMQYRPRGRFLVLTVHITNTGNRSGAWNDLAQTVTDTRGHRYHIDRAATAALDHNPVFLRILPAQATRPISLVFDLPHTATPASTNLVGSPAFANITVPLPAP